MTDDDLAGTADPEAVFALLADDTRVDILRALWAADGGVTFSDLRAAVGHPDSGGFGYHLRELRDRFVEKDGDRYRLTQAGRRVNGAIAAGAYDLTGELPAVELDGDCPTCGGTRTFSYEDGLVRVECDGCRARHGSTVPPGVFAGREPSSAPAVASRHFRTKLRQSTAGFCPYCTGPVEGQLTNVRDVLESVDDAPEDVPDSFADATESVPWARYDCRRCGDTSAAGLDLVLLEHPAVAGFHHERGVDVREPLVWNVTTVDGDRVRFRSETPPRAAVTYEVEGDALTLVVDGSLDVVSIER